MSKRPADVLPEAKPLGENELNNAAYMVTDLIAGDDNVLNNEWFSELQTPQVYAALDYLLNYKGLSDDQRLYLLSNSWRIAYRDKPPTPYSFVNDPKYLGRETLNHIFPHVKEEFIDFMDPTKPYRNFVLAPHIGWGKSTLAALNTIYISIHLSLLRNPQKYLGFMPSAVLCQMLISYTLKKSSELLLEPIFNLLEASDYFEKVHTRDAMIKKEKDFSRMNSIDKIYWTTATPNATSNLSFSNGSNIKLSSSAVSLLGLTVVSGTMSELAFFRDAGKSDEFILRVFNDLKGRVLSRMKGHYLGRSILDSSPNTLDSPIDNYIFNEAHKDPTNKIVTGARWKWFPNEFDFDKTFNVFKGSKGQPARVIEDGENLAQYDPIDLIEVPDMITAPGRMRQIFVDDIYKSIKDYAGIPTTNADKLIYNYEKIDNIFVDKLRNIYNCIGAPITEFGNNIIWNKIRDMFFVQIAGRYQFYYKPRVPRVFHADLSYAEKGDMCSIAIGHVEYDEVRECLVTVIDMTVNISPEFGKINLDAIKFFIEDLVKIGNMSIIGGTFDSFQSEALVQYLDRIGIPTHVSSVDRSIEPYTYMLSLIEGSRLFAGRNIFLKNNLKSLTMSRRKNTGSIKVDHTLGPVTHKGNENWDTSTIGIHAKDSADAVCGVVDMCRKTFLTSSELWQLDNMPVYEFDYIQKKTVKMLNEFGVQI